MRNFILISFLLALFTSCTNVSHDEPFTASSELKSKSVNETKEFNDHIFLLKHLVLNGTTFALDISLEKATKFGVSEKSYKNYVSAIENCNTFYVKHIEDFADVDLNKELKKIKESYSTDIGTAPLMAILPDDDDRPILFGTFQLSFPFDIFVSAEGYVPTNAVGIMGGIINGYISPTPYLYTCKTIVLGIETSKSGISNRSFNEVISVPIPGVMARVSVTASEYISGAYGCANL